MEWIACSQRMPERFQSVALLDLNSWENSPVDRHIQRCGYLNNDGLQDYWSVIDKRAQGMSAYTHWCPLPEPPVLEDEDLKSVGD